MNAQPHLVVTLADNSAKITAAQRLRYNVFVEELGADGPLVDHNAKLEADRFDPHAVHMLLQDMSRRAGDQVVGVYRLLTAKGAAEAGQFYCEDEFDLTPLRASGKRLLELGRSCLHRDYRTGPGMHLLWSALADYTRQNQIDILFGVASFHGTDTRALRQPLSLLHARYLAPVSLRVEARGPHAQAMDMLASDQIDRVAAMRATPALIKAYLRLGGMVGKGAFVDHAFNTTDVCLILPTDAVDPVQRDRLLQGGRHG